MSTISDEVEELLIGIHKEGIFSEVMQEVNNIVDSNIIHIKSRNTGRMHEMLVIYNKAIENVRRNKTV